MPEKQEFSRIRIFALNAGVLYILLQATANGHTYLPEEELLSQASELLRIEVSFIDKHLMDMQLDKRLVIRESEGKRIVYASQYYYMELNVAKMLHDLNIRGKMPEEEIRAQLLKIQKEGQIELDEKQVQAVVGSGQQRASHRHRRSRYREDHHHQHHHTVL